MDSRVDYKKDGYHKGFIDGRRTGGKISKSFVDNYLKYEIQNLSAKDAL